MFVPNLYYSQRITDRFSAGIGIFSPFGLSTDYDPSWVGRYHAVESVLKTLNINPAAALRLTNRLSFGAGVNIQYAKAKLSNAIDFGTIFGTLGMPGMAPQDNDGFVTFKGDGWSWGYNLGFLYEINDRTRTGIAYRSRIRQTLEGDADFSRVPSPNPTGRFLDTGIRSSVTFPDSLSLNIWHNFSKEFAIMADLTWTNWSTFKEIRIKFDNPVESDAVTTMEWKDRYRFSVGAVYMPGDWTFRTGVAFDPTPIPDAAHRTPRIPDSHRTWIALGLGRNLGDRLSFDLGYAHLFANDPEIRKTPTGEDRLRGGISGSYKGRVDIFSLELTWSF
jgi:long-chain fatty acid transport protein